jgi:hypothetical protein
MSQGAVGSSPFWSSVFTRSWPPEGGTPNEKREQAPRTPNAPRVPAPRGAFGVRPACRRFAMNRRTSPADFTIAGADILPECPAYGVHDSGLQSRFGGTVNFRKPVIRTSNSKYEDGLDSDNGPFCCMDYPQVHPLREGAHARTSADDNHRADVALYRAGWKRYSNSLGLKRISSGRRSDRPHGAFDFTYVDECWGFAGRFDTGKFGFFSRGATCGIVGNFELRSDVAGRCDYHSSSIIGIRVSTSHFLLNPALFFFRFFSQPIQFCQRDAGSTMFRSSLSVCSSRRDRPSSR